MEFSNWRMWKDRNNLIGKDKCIGIYCIAYSEKDISNNLFGWIPQIVYIGVTNSIGGLKSRLLQFHKTIEGKLQHGGADRFKEGYRHLSSNVIFSNLYVAVCPFYCNVESNEEKDFHIMGEVAKSEYVCFAEYVKHHGKLPKFNDKKNSKKFSLIERDKPNES
jgi:hypothetical protein